jgi:nucleotide-binding universal stress UspA family protein
MSAGGGRVGSATGASLLVCTDGSPGSREAIRRAAEVFPGATARVVCAWSRRSGHEPRTSLGAAVALLEPPDEVDARAAAEALRIAEDGAELAAAHGLVATAEAPGGGDPVDVLLDVAERLAVTAIVVAGPHHRRSAELLQGSVTRELVRRANRPVLVVPAAAPPAA